MEESSPILSPEEEECNLKESELASLESHLAEVQGELEALRADLSAFEAEYLKIVAPCYAEMDQLRADAEEAAALNAGEEAATCPSAAQAYCPPGELKTLFREVAKSVHPDLASSDDERRRRDEMMAHANAAYANGNPEQLRDLLLKWKMDPDAVEGDDIAARLIRVIRRIAQVKSQTAEVRREMKDLRQTDLYFLRQRAERARASGRDLLLETRANLERQIQQQRDRVAEMRQGVQ